MGSRPAHWRRCRPRSKNCRRSAPCSTRYLSGAWTNCRKRGRRPSKLDFALMRRLLFNLHLYVALIAGVFIVILGVTGSIMAFEQEIDRVLHWKLTYVTPQSRVHSLAEISEAVARAFPG